MPRTKSLIADRGMTFTNSFVTNPLCCPSRATFLTGMYPHNTEVFDSITGLDNFAARGSKKTIAVRLGEAGYETAFIGKYLNGYDSIRRTSPPDWDEWFGLAGEAFISGYSYQANHNGTMEEYGTTPSDYQTDVLSRTATDFIDESEENDERPILLTLFPSAPHGPIRPAPRHKDNKFADDPLPKRPNFNEADVSDKPRWLRELFPELTPAEIERRPRATAIGWDHCSRWMRWSGRSRTAPGPTAARQHRVRLRERQRLSPRSHRLSGKLVPYEESIRVPLAIAGPGVRQGTTDQLVANIDMAATMYDIAGLSEPSDVDGMSLAPLLRGDQPPWRSDFLIEYRGSYHEFFQIHTLEDVQSYVRNNPDLPRLIPDYRAVRTARMALRRVVRRHGPRLRALRHGRRPVPTVEPLGRRRGSSTPRPHHEHAPQARLEALASCSGPTCDGTSNSACAPVGAPMDTVACLRRRSLPQRTVFGDTRAPLRRSSSDRARSANPTPASRVGGGRRPAHRRSSRSPRRRDTGRHRRRRLRRSA